IELSDDEYYRGYWESRGYSNKGDLDKTFIERLP
ncbi:MAG: oxidoreductase, partial [Dehalococcoidia bacterium]